jgi:hypothetical protein
MINWRAEYKVSNSGIQDEDGGQTSLQTVGILPYNYIVSLHRKLWLKASLLWKLQISQLSKCHHSGLLQTDRLTTKSIVVEIQMFHSWKSLIKIIQIKYVKKDTTSITFLAYTGSLEGDTKNFPNIL